MKRLKKSTASKNWIECIFPLSGIDPAMIFETSWDKRFDKSNWEDPIPVSVLLDNTLAYDTMVIQYGVYFEKGYRYFEANSKQEEFLGKLDNAVDRYKKENGFKDIAFAYAKNIIVGSEDSVLYGPEEEIEIKISDDVGCVILETKQPSGKMKKYECFNEIKTLAQLISNSLCSGEYLHLTVTVFIRGRQDWKMSRYLMEYFYDVKPHVADAYTWIRKEDMVTTILGRYWCYLPGKYSAKTNSSLTVVPKELMCSLIKHKATFKKLLIDFANGENIGYHSDTLIWILTRYWDD